MLAMLPNETLQSIGGATGVVILFALLLDKFLDANGPPGRDKPPDDWDDEDEEPDF